MLNWERTRYALEEYKTYVIREARKNLQRNRMGRNTRLYKSLRGIVALKQNRDLRGRFGSGKQPQLTFEMNYYGKFVDKGVKGTKENAVNKPFSFKKSKKMVNIGAIENFVAKKGIRSRKRKSLIFAIAKSIHQKGIKRSLFFTKPLERRKKRYTDKIAAGAADDIALEFVKQLKIYFKDIKVTK